MRNFSRRMQIFHGELFEVDAAWNAALQAAGIQPGNNWTKFASEDLVSWSPSTKCYRVQLDDGRVIFFKRYVYPKKKWFEFWLRAGKAGVEVFAYQQLTRLGIPAPRAIAFGEYRRLGMLLATFIVTPEVSNTVELEKFAIDDWYLMPEPQRSKVFNEIAGKLVQQMRRAHKANFFHHDLKWRNILIQKDDAGYMPVWIDPPRASFMWIRRRRGVIVDFSGLAREAASVLSVYDRMRFVCHYLGRERKPGEAKLLYREVAAHLSRRPPKPMQLPEC